MTEKKYIRKSFWIHQYENEEVFLRYLRKKGWKFVRLHKGLPTKYEFEACEPEDYIYQIDYIETEKDTEEYHQLFKDAGWEEIMPWFAIGGRWYYFCKKVNSKQDIQERIYTDEDSKINLVNRLWKRYTLFLILCTVMEINGIISSTNIFLRNNTSAVLITLAVVSIILFSSVIIFAVYNICGLYALKRRLEKQKSQIL